MEIEEKDYDYIVTPFHEKLARVFPIPYPVVWMIYSCILLTPHIFLLLTSKETSLLIPHLIMGFLPANLSIATIWFSKLLERFTPSMFIFIDWPKDKCLKWYDSEINSIFNSKRMCHSGILMAVVMLPFVLIGPLMPKYIWAQTTFLIIMFILNFFAGSMIYTMIRMWIMVYKIGNIKEIKVSVYQHPVTSVKAVGKLLSRITLTIVAIYIFGVSYLIFSKPDVIMFLMCSFFGIFVIAFFIFPQIKIHKIMSKIKHKRLRQFSVHIEEALQAVTSDPSGKNVQKVRELFEIQQSLNQMGEWPFDTKLLFTILTGVGIPIALVLLQMLGKHLWKF